MAEKSAAYSHERQHPRKNTRVAKCSEIDALVAKHTLDDVLTFEEVKMSPAASGANKIVPGLGVAGEPLDAKPARVSLAPRRHRTWWLWK